ncbi:MULTISPECIES: N-acetylmuramoyl-L-alanine amidase [Deinococcus]|uniref:Cell wall hydrolase/autolysin n=1 Tax=Deinococcus geothermalis (strain DSM 11300 / CIP 105573 / AG-3a) TaxID=319795 RepID=Q1J062_DEIGD|nr:MULTISPECIES: N-acetylmuramoyl-L-alanine amidase [Deinococcus]ABF45122.1 cell wall hydrolase/autolysin [Deinococcus geothermalis DSM 11300]MBI0444406.1 N-acetylmuramoyl-L-alanine amidase [Deinococcus sp. DB0503]TDE87611.1 N-acetylmuramoyl-L-alanine amidase [Deinococcus sp. S9]
MRLRLSRPLLLSAALLCAGLAGAQIAFTRLNLAGQQVQAINLYGAEYASETVLGQVLTITQDGGIARVEGFGHTLLLPIDEDQQRATTDFNVVQLDTERVHARSATLVNGHLYLPLDTLARGLGASYEVGNFRLVPATLQGVSSRAGKDSDRLVLDLTRDVPVTDELRGTTVTITLKGVQGEARRYTTRGAFVPQAEVTRSGDDLQLTFTLPPGSGYRVYRVVRPGGARLVVDAGPGVPYTSPALLERISRPLIVLDPARVSGLGRDVTLEVARRAAELLNKAGWQVKLTRDAQSALGLNQKLDLARRSDVYLALDLGRFPGSQRGGVTVYEPTGSAPAQIVENVRNGAQAPYLDLAVGNGGGTRRLSELLRGELKGSGVTAQSENVTRSLTLSEAPQAALLLELGWVSNAEDRAKLAVDDRLQAMSVAVARSIATYLTARAANAGRLAPATGAGQNGGQP